MGTRARISSFPYRRDRLNGSLLCSRDHLGRRENGYSRTLYKTTPPAKYFRSLVILILFQSAYTELRSKGKYIYTKREGTRYFLPVVKKKKMKKEGEASKM